MLDFYGSQISIRDGRVVVPGGRASEGAWKDLVGASPEAPADFVTKLLAKDEGWVAVYYDVLSRVNSTQQAYFADPHRLSHFYEALRGKDISPSPARPVFRPDPGLLLLATRLRLEPNGQPRDSRQRAGLEGDRSRRTAKTTPRSRRKWPRTPGHWNNPDQVIEGHDRILAREPARTTLCRFS